MITVDGVEVELLPYPLWAVWFRMSNCAAEQRDQLFDEDVWLGQVAGFGTDGNYCVSSGGGLHMLDEDHFDQGGELESFGARKEAEDFYKSKQVILEAEFRAYERTIRAIAKKQNEEQA